MDYSRSQDDPMGFGYNSSNPNPNPNPNPPPITIRPSSAFSKPMNNIPSSSSSSALLSPRDHHHHHHHHHRNGTSASSDQFGTPAADPVPMAVSPASTPIINSLCPPKSTSAAALAALSTMIKYRECLRNHAASIGGHVLDGCCEFMPGDADPLKCAACDCHRSFHRKLTEGAGDYSRSIRDHHDHRVVSSVPLLLPPPHPVAALHNHHQSSSHHQKHFASTAAIPPVPSAPPPHVLAFGGGTIANATIANSNNNNNNSGSGATTESSSEERMDASTAQAAMNMIVSKKRFRTKFTAEQKEKMMGFAERVGWRIQRQDEATVEEFCKDVGVKRQVLKVWMHNNKHSTREQQQQMRHQTQLGSAEAPPPPPPPLQQQQAAAAPAPSPSPSPSPSPAIFGHMRN